MAQYTVQWALDVQSDFTNHWIVSSSEQRTRLTRASDMIDKELAVVPQQRGQPIPTESGVRIWNLPGFMPRITVVYEVLEDDRVVRVLSIAVAT